jgi:pimeloyl-ACP methyl ester carboxylesterase
MSKKIKCGPTTRWRGRRISGASSSEMNNAAQLAAVRQPNIINGVESVKMHKRLTAIVCVLLVIMASCTPRPEAPRDDLVDIGTHRLYIHCTGTGRPTVVIDTGLGESYESWESVITMLSHQTRVCAYDRAGYGQSEPGPMPRESKRTASELHLLLANSGEDGPFLLVGHSLGGLNMQVYASTYPEEVAGLVLLDPSPLAWMMGEGFPELRELFNQQGETLREEADVLSMSSDPDAIAIAPFMDATASEFEEFFGPTADEVAGISSFGELPLTVIGATEPDPSFGEFGQAFRQFWNEESMLLARKSESGQFIMADGSSHHIHLDAPQLVIDAILQLMQ